MKKKPFNRESPLAKKLKALTKLQRQIERAKLKAAKKKEI
jgi:hypothetical protein